MSTSKQKQLARAKECPLSAPSLGSLADLAVGTALDAAVGQKITGKIDAYSTDGNAMIAVLETMRGRGYSIHFAFLLCGCACASFVARAKLNQAQAPAGHDEATSLPEVVCRAALRAIESEQENINTVPQGEEKTTL